MSANCFDCGHAISDHSGEYRGWDKRTSDYNPEKEPGCGCLIAGCGCRRWYEPKPRGVSDAPLTQADEREWSICPDCHFVRYSPGLCHCQMDGQPGVHVLVVPKARLVEVERERDEAKILGPERDGFMAEAEEYREALSQLLEWAKYPEGCAPSGIRMIPAIEQAEAVLSRSSGASGMLSSHPEGDE